MGQILLEEEEIGRAMFVDVPEGSTVKVWGQSIAKAQLRKVATEFDSFGIYETHNDRFFWNPEKLREFMDILRREAE